MRERRENWIVATGQAWKLYLALMGLLGSVLCFGAAILSLGSDTGAVARLTTVGILLVVATIAWLGAVLRCPHCSVKLMWKMLAQRSHTSWLVELAALESCPACHRSLYGRPG